MVICKSYMHSSRCLITVGSVLQGRAVVSIWTSRPRSSQVYQQVGVTHWYHKVKPLNKGTLWGHYDSADLSEVVLFSKCIKTIGKSIIWDFAVLKHLGSAFVWM